MPLMKRRSSACIYRGFWDILELTLTENTLSVQIEHLRNLGSTETSVFLSRSFIGLKIFRKRYITFQYF